MLQMLRQEVPRLPCFCFFIKYFLYVSKKVSVSERNWYRKNVSNSVSEKVSDSVSFRFWVLSHTVPGTLADIALLCSFLYKNPNVNKLSWAINYWYIF